MKNLVSKLINNLAKSANEEPLYRITPTHGGYKLSENVAPFGWRECGEPHPTIEAAEAEINRLEGKTLYIYESEPKETVKIHEGQTLTFLRTTAKE